MPTHSNGAGASFPNHVTGLFLKDSAVKFVMVKCTTSFANSSIPVEKNKEISVLKPARGGLLYDNIGKVTNEPTACTSDSHRFATGPS